MIEVDGIQCYVTIRDGMLHAMIRATDRATFRAQAEAVRLIVRDAEGNLRVHRNVDMTEEQPDPADPRSAPMPRIMTDPGVQDEDGNYTTPPTFDSRYHANFRLNAAATAAGAWRTWALAWTAQGSPGTANAGEAAIEYQGIELIDPDSISSPANRWA